MAALKSLRRNDRKPDIETIDSFPIVFSDSAMGAVLLKSYENDGGKGYFVQVVKNQKKGKGEIVERSVSLGGDPKSLDAVCAGIQHMKAKLLAKRK